MSRIDEPELDRLDRPDGLSLAEGVSRQFDYWFTVYKRTWRGTLITSFVSPFFYVIAMGVLLGGFVKADPAELEGATSYLAFVVPGLVAAHAMQTAVGETTYPVMALIKWQRVYDSMLATPLQVRHLVTATPDVRRLPAGDHVCGVHAGAGAVRRLRELVGRDPRLPPQILVGMAFASLVYAHHGADEVRGGLRGDLPARRLPAVPLLGGVLPDLQPRRCWAPGRPG